MQGMKISHMLPSISEKTFFKQKDEVSILNIIPSQEILMDNMKQKLN